jgi:hypothetical protein
MATVRACLLVSFSMIGGVHALRLLPVVHHPSLAAARGGLGRREICQLAGGAAACAIARPALAASRSYTKAEASDAVGRMRAVRAALDEVAKAAASKRFDAALELLGAPLITGFEKDCTTLVQSSVLTPEDKVAIGTVRRYGIAADVIIMVGGLASAAAAANGPSAVDYSVKARAALDEILVIMQAYDL